MDHAFQAPGAGHVDAVVVARAQVQGGEVAVLEAGRQLSIAAQQRDAAVMLALGLKNSVALDAAQLAHSAINRAHQPRFGQRPHPGLEGAGEKIVEGGVGAKVGLQRLAHVHAVARGKAAHRPLRGGTEWAPRQGAGQFGQGLFGQGMLQPCVVGCRRRLRLAWRNKGIGHRAGRGRVCKRAEF